MVFVSLQMNLELKRRGEVIESLRSDEALKKKSSEEAHSFEAEAAELRAKVEQLQRELSDAKKKEGGIHQFCHHFGTFSVVFADPKSLGKF